MITEQKPTSEWQQGLVENWKGCAYVRLTLEEVQPGDIILAQYSRPRREDSPPSEHTDSQEVFIMLEKPEDKFPRDFRTLRIVLLSATAEVLDSVSWGTTSLPEDAQLWLLGSCTGSRVPDVRWMDLSLHVHNMPMSV